MGRRDRPGPLMLARLERLVTQAGGSYAFCDTDSMAVVATEDGGYALKALSWEEVESDGGVVNPHGHQVGV